MYYVINVARRAVAGRPPLHIFRTAPDSVTDAKVAKGIVERLRQVYQPNLYDITVWKESTIGEYVDPEDL